MVICAFERYEKLSYPLPKGITNYVIYELVYGTAMSQVLKVEMSAMNGQISLQSLDR